jgi:hypothetical protein
VVHISDQHVGRVTPESVQRAAIELANEQEPDLVALTGDFVCHSLDYLDQLTSLLRAIRAPSVAVLGNHDHWSGANEVRRALRSAGVELLDNANTRITLHGQTLQVVGLDDAYTGHADLSRALVGLDPRLPTLGLSHIAEEAEGLWQAGASLVLSGHTHSGHVAWGRMHHLLIGGLAGHRYVHGLYGCRRGIEAPGAVYVNAGIGAAVMGLRLGERARREVAVFRLGEMPGEALEHHAEQQALPGRAPSEQLKARRIAQVERKAWLRDQKRRDER